jgi:hypothetical protein
MGNKSVKPSHASQMASGSGTIMAEKVEFVLPSTMTTVYTLRFTGNVIRHRESKEVRSKHMRHARDDLEHNHEWDEWLGWTMRDAIVNEFETKTGQEIHTRDAAPVTDIKVVLDPRIKRSGIMPDAHTRISGVITWRSVATEPSALRAAVDWRLGDRMAFYGLQDEEEGWSYIFSPGQIVAEPFEPSARSDSE